jgi:hypothetical protein
VDSGFVGHAEDTAAWVRAQVGHLALVVNTPWHAVAWSDVTSARSWLVRPILGRMTIA